MQIKKFDKVYSEKLHSVQKQVQPHFSWTAASSEDSSATDLIKKNQLLINLRMKQLYN